MRSRQFLKGVIHGIPIFLGYLSVSFGFGIMAVRSGLSVAEAAAISLFNLTSAGQASQRAGHLSKWYWHSSLSI